MLTRIATGLVLAPLVVWLLLAGPAWAVAGVFIAAAGLCANELLAMLVPGRTSDRVIGILTTVGVLVGLWQAPFALLEGLVAAFLVPALAVLIRPLPLETAASRLTALWATFAYITLPFSFGIELATEESRWSILLLLSVVWAGDTGAYFVGRALGRHKLYPAVSPKKTIEGALGGLAASMGAAVLIANLWMPELGPLHAALIGLVGGFAAQVGDLVESMIKRAAGVKDSGTLLPGHGGMLDRLDGVIFAFPVVTALLG